ncbi:MAG: glycosyltransferase family 4 protein [Cytophagales bacterium]
MIKVNIDATGLHGLRLTGVGVYIQNLIAALKKLPDLTLSASYKISNIKNDGIIRSRTSLPLETPYIPHLYKIIPKKYSLFHGPDYWIPSTKSIKKVVTIHDFSVFHKGLWSQEFAIKGIEKLSKVINQNQPDQIIVVSDFVKEELKTLFPQFSDKVTTVYHGVDHFSKGISTPKTVAFPYILCVGTIEVRKNVLNLAKAFALLASKHPDLRLIFAGGTSGFKGPEIATELRTIRNVMHLDYVSKDTVQNLIENAIFVAYPSLYEGFGFPILEAMYLETPVFTSNFGAMKEVAGGNAFLSNTLEIDALASDLASFLEDEPQRNRLRDKAKSYVSNFTWAKAAQQTFEVYKKALEGPK